MHLENYAFLEEQKENCSLFLVVFCIKQPIEGIGCLLESVKKLGKAGSEN